MVVKSKFEKLGLQTISLELIDVELENEITKSCLTLKITCFKF